jgi:hypothetical protein
MLIVTQLNDIEEENLKEFKKKLPIGFNETKIVFKYDMSAIGTVIFVSYEGLEEDISDYGSW